MKNIDLTSQFIFYLAITLIGVIGAMNFWFYHDHTTHLTEALENRAAAKLDFIESSTAYYLEHYENELIVELGKEAMFNDHEVVFLSIADADGSKFFEEGSPEYNDGRLFSRQIIQDGKKIGNLMLSMDIRQLMSDRRETMLYNIGMIFISVSLIGGMIYLFYRKRILYEFNRVHSEKEFLSDEHEFFMSIINTASNMVIVLDRHGYIMMVNQVYADILESSADALIEKHISSTVDFDCEGQILSSALTVDLAAEFEVYSEKLLHKHCRSVLTIDDAEIHVEWKFTRLVGENGQTKSLIGTGVDITHQHQKQLELSYRANHDQLTSLPNRTLFNDRLQEAFKQAERQSSVFALLFIDLDHFKPVNDKYGHEAGDLVLKTVSRRMQSAIRNIDTVARLGGDEFGVLFLNVKDKENISRLTGVLLREISKPVFYGSEMLNIGASIGIAFYSEKVKDAKELINQADSAMYQAKNAGRNQYCYFDGPAQLASVTDLKPRSQ